VSITTIFNVPGMSCEHCVSAINGEVVKVDGVSDVTIDLKAKTVAVTGGEDTAIIEAIDEAGYDVEGTGV